MTRRPLPELGSRALEEQKCWGRMVPGCSACSAIRRIAATAIPHCRGDIAVKLIARLYCAVRLRSKVIRQGEGRRVVAAVERAQLPSGELLDRSDEPRSVAAPLGARPRVR